MDAHRASLGAKPRASAVWAGGITSVAAEEDANMQLVLLSLKPSKEAFNSRKSCVAIAFDDAFSLFDSKLTERHIQRNSARAGEPFEVLPKRAITRLGPRLNSAFVNGLAAIGDD